MSAERNLEALDQALSQLRAGSRSALLAEAEEPVPELPAAPEFPLAVLPEAARARIARGLEAGLPQDFLGVAALVTLAGALGGAATVRLSESWTERAIVWAGLVGQPGSGKSPSVETMAAPLRLIQRSLFSTYEQERREWEELPAKERRQQSRPSALRLVIGDTTVEALLRQLAAHPATTLLADELRGLLSSLGQYKRSGGSDRDRLLELWNGADLAYQRATDDLVLYLASPTLAILGGIQPSRLSALGDGDDGLRARWLLVAARPQGLGSLPAAPEGGPEPDPWERLVAAIYSLRGASREWRLDPEAQELFTRARAEWRAAGLSSDEPMHVRELQLKADRYLLRLALVLAETQRVTALPLSDERLRAPGVVTVEVVQAAVQLLAYFIGHRRALRFPVVNLMSRPHERDRDHAVDLLAEWLEGRPDRRATRREIQRSRVAGARTGQDVDALVTRYAATFTGCVWQEPAAAGPERTIVVAPPRRARGDDAVRQRNGELERPSRSVTTVTTVTTESVENRVRDGVDAHLRVGESSLDGAETLVLDFPGGDSGDSGDRSPGPSQAVEVHDAVEVRPGAHWFDREPLLVTTVSEVQGLLPELLAAPALGLDLESTGLDPFTARLRLVQLATPDRTCVVDAFRVPPPALQPVLDHARCLAGHNLKFDLRHLQAAGLSLSANIGDRLADTMLLSQLLSAGVRGHRHRLADLVGRHLGLELDKAEQSSDWSGELSREQLLYAARDAAVLLPLAERLEAETERAGLADVAVIEHGALPALVWLEQAGAPFDSQGWLALAAAQAEIRSRLAGELTGMVDRCLLGELPLDDRAGSPVNWDSQSQVLDALRSRGVVLADTSEATLREHAERDPLIGRLLEYREVSKLATTYGPDFLKHLHPKTGRIHADYRQLGADPGRMSCSRPNLQQVPRAGAYRACFRAPAGRLLVKADYSQIELRIAAEIAEDRRLLEAFEAGLDVHELTAREVLGQAEITQEARQAAKVLNFGLVFGMGSRRLRSYARNAYGVDMGEQEAVDYRQRFFATYSGLRAWHRSQPEGSLDTRTLAGRRRLGVESFTEKLNSPVQGTGADGLKNALALLFESRDEVPGAEPVLVVHDEVVMECDLEQAEQVGAWLERCLRSGMGALLRRVPVEVETRVGRDWSMAAPSGPEAPQP